MPIWFATLIFMHVLGMLGLFITMGIDWLSTQQLRQAQSIAVVRLWAMVMQPLALMYSVSEVLILLTGWGLLEGRAFWSTAWLVLSLVATVVLAVTGATVGGTRLQALRRRLTGLPDGPLAMDIQQRTQDGVLLGCVRMLALLSVGIVVLMVFKPTSWVLGMVILIMALLIGFLATVVSLPRTSTRR